MRILIIAQPRTGSTVFSKWLSDELQYQRISEPFNMDKKSEIEDLFNKDNIVVKLIYEIGRGEWFYDKRINDIEHLFSMNWDSIFILTRNDLKEQAISKVWADTNQKWHTNYKINDDWIKKHKKILEKYVKELEFDKTYLKSIGYNQICYENIYENAIDLKKICELLKINQLKYIEDLNLKNRYRGGPIVKNTKII